MIRLNYVSDQTLFRVLRKLPDGSDGFFIFKAGDRLDSSTSVKNYNKFADELMNCILRHYHNAAMLISDLEMIKPIYYKEYIYIIYDVDAAVNMNLFSKNQALIDTGVYTEGKDFYYKDKLKYIRHSTPKDLKVIYEPYIEEESDIKMEAF